MPMGICTICEKCIHIKKVGLKFDGRTAEWAPGSHTRIIHGGCSLHVDQPDRDTGTVFCPQCGRDVPLDAFWPNSCPGVGRIIK